MTRIHLVSLILALLLLAAGPLAAQEATPASEEDRALLNAATAQLLRADTLLIDMDLGIFIGHESDMPALLDLSATGQLALDMMAEQGSLSVSYELNGALAGLRAILSGDQLYISMAEEWFLLAPPVSEANEVDPAAAAINIDLGSLGELWRLPDEQGWIQLQSTVDVLAFATDPELARSVGEILSLLPAGLLGITGASGEELAALLPLLSVIIQEPRIETTYRIEPRSGELRKLNADISFSLNPALLGSEGLPLTVELLLDARMSANVPVEIGAAPANATEISLDELLVGVLH